MRLRILAILACPLLLSGCFVLDEFEKGDALIEQHSVGWRKKKQQMAEEAAKKAEAEAHASKDWKFWEEKKDPTLRDHLSEWWSNALEEPTTSARSGADPDDGIVRCTIGSQVIFTRESDCIARRGRFQPRPGAKDTSPSS